MPWLYKESVHCGLAAVSFVIAQRHAPFEMGVDVAMNWRSHVEGAGVGGCVEGGSRWRPTMCVDGSISGAV